jgi:hypothetical protein
MWSSGEREAGLLGKGLSTVDSWLKGVNRYQIFTFAGCLRQHRGNTVGPLSGLRLVARSMLYKNL